jgi:hypothetical protein
VLQWFATKFSKYRTRYVAGHGKGRVAKAVLISSVPPQLLKSDKNPDGLPMAVFDQLRDGTGNHRSQFYQDITMPFYGFNRPGAKISQGIRDTRSAPTRVGQTRSPDEIPDFTRYRWVASALATLPGPVEPKAFAMPGDNGLGLDDNQWRSPCTPQA